MFALQQALSKRLKFVGDKGGKIATRKGCRITDLYRFKISIEQTLSAFAYVRLIYCNSSAGVGGFGFLKTHSKII